MQKYNPVFFRIFLRILLIKILLDGVLVAILMIHTESGLWFAIGEHRLLPTGKYHYPAIDPFGGVCCFIVNYSPLRSHLIKIL